MVKIIGQAQAFGSPGITPRWTQANKDGVSKKTTRLGEGGVIARSNFS